MDGLGVAIFVAERCLTNAGQSIKVIDAPPMKTLLAILFWATLAAYALATFLDPEFPGILDILNNF